MNFKPYTEREIKKHHSGVCETSLSDQIAIIFKEDEEEIKEESCTCAKSKSK